MELDVMVRLATGGISLGSLYALVALGFVLMMLVSDLLNFALGEIMMVAAFAALFMLNAGVPWPLAFLLAALLAGGVGLAMERLAFRPLWAKGAPPINVVVASIAISIFVANMALRTVGAVPRAFPAVFGNEVQTFGPIRVVPQELAVIVAGVLTMTALQLFFRKTTAGLAMRAVMTDRETASLMGVDVPRAIALTFAISAALGGAAGVLLAPLIFVQWDMGLIAVKGMVAATLGGIYSLPGAILGGLVLGTLETFLAYFVSSSFRDALVYGMMVVILLLLPEGLAGMRRRAGR